MEIDVSKGKSIENGVFHVQGGGEGGGGGATENGLSVRFLLHVRLPSS